MKYSDGTEQIIASGADDAPLSTSTSTAATSGTATGTDSWQVGDSALLFNNIYLGEYYDARLEAKTKGWSSAGFDDKGWGKPVLHPAASNFGEMQGMDGTVPPITWHSDMVPVDIKRVPTCCGATG